MILGGLVAAVLFVCLVFVVFDYFVLVIINFCCVHVISCEHKNDEYFRQFSAAIIICCC